MARFCEPSIFMNCHPERSEGPAVRRNIVSVVIIIMNCHPERSEGPAVRRNMQERGK
jgi:hypothetical protein